MVEEMGEAEGFVRCDLEETRGGGRELGWVVDQLVGVCGEMVGERGVDHWGDVRIRGNDGVEQRWSSRRAGGRPVHRFC